MKRIWLLSILLSMALLCSCTFDFLTNTSTASPTTSVTTLTTMPDTPSTPSTSSLTTDAELQVIVLDVGQADCVLLKTGNHAMLVDAGNIGQDSLILNYLNEYGVKNLDYIVATHPHADHIGAMAAVIRGMDSIGMILMPDVTTTTRTFENMLDAIEEKDVPINIPNPGDVITMGDAQIQILAPNGVAYNDLNDYSIVLRVAFGNSVFLLTGDAETKSEGEQLANSLLLNADVLKVGHHGSRTSSTQAYLDAVSPSYAVISCGLDNTYGHPHRESVTRLAEMGVETYRTDENGTVIFTTDGNAITVSTTRVSTTPTATASYIGNINSKIFHLSTCSGLPLEQNRVYFATRNEAINDGYTPCSICKP